MAGQHVLWLCLWLHCVCGVVSHSSLPPSYPFQYNLTVMPTEIDHIDELIDEYEGREAELLDTLAAMRENEELMSESETNEQEDSTTPTTTALDNNNNKDSKKKAVVAALPKIMSEDQIYESSPLQSPNSQHSEVSYEKELLLGETAEARAAAKAANPEKYTAKTTSSGAAEESSSNLSVRQAAQQAALSKHFKDIATADDTMPDVEDEYSKHSIAYSLSDSTEQTANGDRKTKNAIAAGIYTSGENKSGMSQAEIAARNRLAGNTTAVAVAVGVAAATAPSPQDDLESGNVAAAAVGNTDEKKDDPQRSKKVKMLVFFILFMVVAGVGAALGVVFGGNNDDGTVSEGNSNDETDFVPRPPGMPTTDGTPPTITKVPTKSPSGPLGSDVMVGFNDNYDANAPASACNTLPGANIQELGVKTLQAEYPMVAVDGDQAIVAAGGTQGLVAFYNLNNETRRWERDEVFGTMRTIGDITSVAIHGNTAVIGAPRATTNLGIQRDGDEPFISGAIYIYERVSHPTGKKWRQLRGHFMPEEYNRANAMQLYQNARFGMSVDVHGDLIVAGAPEELSNKGSITVFRKTGNGLNGWEQVKHVTVNENDLCETPYLGFSVQVHGDTIAASADCDINMQLYEYMAYANGVGGSLNLVQQLEIVDVMWGAISSITMDKENLVYSTVFGGLFAYRRQNAEFGGNKYFRTQLMNFDVSKTGFHPVAMDANMLTLAIANEIYIYTQDETTRQWKRETIVLGTTGDYAGYVGPSVAISDGQLMIASTREVNVHDFTDCAVFEVRTPEPTAAPTTQPPTPAPVIPPSTDTCILINLVFDTYPSDTSWQIETIADKTVVARSAPFADSLTDSSSRVCLPDGKYAFVISDVYGDGM